jgi:hypothetical protein
VPCSAYNARPLSPRLRVIKSGFSFNLLHRVCVPV